MAVLAIAAASACADGRPSSLDGVGTGSAPSLAAPQKMKRLPVRYLVVGPRGATAFAAPPTHHPPSPAAATTTAAGGSRVGPGFGFAVTGERSVAGLPYLQISDGRWLAAADVTPVIPSAFHGTAISSAGGPRIAWVVATLEATVRTRPDRSADILTTRAAHSRVILRGPCDGGWCPLGVGWVRVSDVAFPTYRDRPAGLGPDERWIDIDLQAQILVAYEGDRPVYATLVSTGLGAPGSPFATPTGLFTIFAKRLLVRMDNLEHTDVVPYAYDVPLAQYFTDGKAIHAALWHDHFGHPTSHGCVNLAPADADWLFAFTSPVVGAERTGAFANTSHPGTVVVVRGRLARSPLRPPERVFAGGETRLNETHP